SSASERCPRASASSRVRASSWFFNSISELGPLLTCALAFVPVERGLRSRVGLFAPLRDKVTSSAQLLVPSGQPSLSILTEPRDELAPLHSITSSARPRSVGAISIPIAFAVFRLITISNLVGCSTGSSPGFAPRKILSTYDADRRQRSARLVP